MKIAFLISIHLYQFSYIKCRPDIQNYKLEWSAMLISDVFHKFYYLNFILMIIIHNGWLLQSELILYRYVYVRNIHSFTNSLRYTRSQVVYGNQSFLCIKSDFTITLLHIISLRPFYILLTLNNYSIVS